MNEDTWPTWFRSNSDKFLLTLILFGFLAFTFHAMHDARDDSQVQFMNGLTNTFSGALITLVTGAVLRKSSQATASTRDPQTGTTSVATSKEELK